MQLGSYAIFCDDVRQENNGKLIFVGVYNDDLYFQGPPPWTHRQLSIHVMCRSFEKIPSHPVKFAVRSHSAEGITTLWEAETPREVGEPDAADRLDFEEEVDDFYQYMFGIVLSPFVIKGESRLEVVSIDGDKVRIIDRLRIRGMPDNSNDPDWQS